MMRLPWDFWGAFFSSRQTHSRPRTIEIFVDLVWLSPKATLLSSMAVTESRRTKSPGAQLAALEH